MTPPQPPLLPSPDADSAPFWSALQRGTLLFQECKDCGQRQLYFRAMCRRCWSRETIHVPASGAGTIYSYSEIHQASHPSFASEVPFVLGLVTLAEGPRLLARLHGDAASMRIDDPVQLEIDRGAAWALVAFRHGGVQR